MNADNGLPIKRDDAGHPLWAQAGNEFDLHVVSEADNYENDDWWTHGDGTTLCGVAGWLIYPGLLSRMSAPRCATCCGLIGIPAGTGHPKNDDECRALLGYPT